MFKKDEINKKQLKKLNDIKMDMYYHGLEKEKAISRIKKALIEFPKNHNLKGQAEQIYKSFKEEIENYL